MKKLNLTQIKVNQELDNLALIHPSSTYRILLNNAEFRQDLVNYILEKIPNQYLLIESPKEFYKVLIIIKCTPQEKTQIYNLVDQRFNELRTAKKLLIILV